jgi:hypothetical protein
LIGTSNDHQTLDEVSLVLAIEFDVLLLQAIDGLLYDRNGSLDDQVTSVDLSLGLLHLQHCLGHLRCVGDLHDGHAFDSETGDRHTLVKHRGHVFRK